ncbi:MAG: hypothetical protein DI563_05460 [Variovorax paradoxus]|uniref:Uncharacterized protein n=1 Tax=Variovorax paradoxus TaxID=34073 RepID=A0A2W5QKM9_VARPD|nr:MAG: hypothetical protein DI563_05460 [Variovorax paradoxus]
MTFEQLPFLPLYVTGRSELLECVRAAMTQVELLPAFTQAGAANPALINAALPHAQAVANFFTAVANVALSKAGALAASMPSGE